MIMTGAFPTYNVLQIHLDPPKNIININEVISRVCIPFKIFFLQIPALLFQEIQDFHQTLVGPLFTIAHGHDSYNI